MMINIFFDPRCDSLWQKDQSWRGDFYFRGYLGSSAHSIDRTADGIRYRWREAMTYIARTRQWVSRGPVQWSHSSPGHMFCSQGATLRRRRLCLFRLSCICVHGRIRLRPRSRFIFAVACLRIIRQSPLGDQPYATLALAGQYWFHMAINW